MHYEDLLAVPFLLGGDDPVVGLDCWGQAREVCARVGLAFPDVTRTTPEKSDLSGVTSHLTSIPQATQPGDLLLSDPEEYGYPSHVAVVVVPGWVLTTSRKHGPSVMPLHRAPCELGVWRCCS